VPANEPIPEDDFRRLRDRLAQLRAARGLSYQELADVAQISESNLYALETGKARRGGKPVQGSLAVWRKIATALAIPFSDLMRELD